MFLYASARVDRFSFAGGMSMIANAILNDFVIRFTIIICVCWSFHI